MLSGPPRSGSQRRHVRSAVPDDQAIPEPPKAVTVEVPPGDIDVSVTGGSATTGSDYTAPTTLTIGAGSYSATAFALPGLAVTDDALVEPGETMEAAVRRETLEESGILKTRKQGRR